MSFQVIELVAQDSEQKGMLEDSVKLYDLAKKHERVLSLLNKLLAQVVAQPVAHESRRERLQRQAVTIAKRYRNLGHGASAETTATFYLLLDLMTFFDLYHGQKFDEALDTLQKIGVSDGSIVKTILFHLSYLFYRWSHFLKMTWIQLWPISEWFLMK